MKIFLLLFIGIGLFTMPSHAQIEITKPIEQLGFNKNTVVVNKNGIKYGYPVWRQLMASGHYMLKPMDAGSDSTKFILTKIDENIEEKMFSSNPKPDETKFFKNGDTFNFFDLKDINGVVTKAEDLKGKIVVLNFWFIACPPCRYEMPELNKLVKVYQNNKDVVFYAISIDSKKDIERFLKVSSFNYHIISDSWPLFTYYKIGGCPASVVIDREGIIRFNSLAYGNGSTPYWIKKTIAQMK